MAPTGTHTLSGFRTFALEELLKNTPHNLGPSRAENFTMKLNGQAITLVFPGLAVLAAKTTIIQKLQEQKKDIFPFVDVSLLCAALNL